MFQDLKICEKGGLLLKRIEFAFSLYISSYKYLASIKPNFIKAMQIIFFPLDHMSGIFIANQFFKVYFSGWIEP